MVLQMALDGVSFVGGEGAIASQTLTLYQVDSMGSLISVYRDVVCS